ncbi:TetR/AcrR family transcriptional regulator [Pendulispora albinea]|uniref:TetR/AcrR family transcriptional regulator n=1 Tax=Pendulispora albinea TaxID=2741071 RepID=A0ABZ2M4F4_9BACT
MANSNRVKIALEPPTPRSEIRTITPRDWADAALWAIGKSSVAELTIDRVARTLGVTKGSFYWHFKDRNALLGAAIQRWEVICTSQVIEELDALERPRDRLLRLLSTVFDEENNALEIAVLSASEHPLVAPVLTRVAARRLEYLVDTYRGMGLTPADARCSGLLAYSAYVGLLQIARFAPGELPTAQARERYIRYLSARLIPEAQRPRGAK